MKRSTRRIGIAIAAVIVVILVVLAVVPLFLRGPIEQRVQAAVNRNVDAHVAWRDAGLSFFRHFPNPSLTLDGLTVVGTGRFQGDTLAAIRHLGVVVGLGSAVGNVISGKPIVVRAVELDQPRLSLIALEDGTANWNITKKTPAAQPQTSKPLSVSLRSVQINDATIAFDNRRSKLHALLTGYDQSLSGDLSKSQVTIHTRADADTASVTFAGIPYLNRVKLGLTANVRADFAGKSYTLENTELRLNDLALAVSGSARSIGKALDLDLTFNAPSTNFRSILSLVPAIYAHDFDKVQTSGTFAVNGRVKGEYADSTVPSFAINAKVSDASFKYPDLPLPARAIGMDLALTNPGGSPDSTVVTLDRFHMVIGQNPIDAHMVVRTPVSDPDVDARVNGTLDLADVRRTVKLQGIEQLAGTIAANATVHTRMSAVKKKEYNRVAANGTVNVRGLTVKGQALPQPLAIQQASLSLSPQRARLTSFTGTVGSSDLQASGTLDNLLAFALEGDTLHGSATVRSNHFNLDEWRSGGKLQIIPVPPKIDFALDATVGELLYDKLKMSDARARLHIKDQRVTLDEFNTNTLGGQIAVTGYYETTQPEKPTFDVNFQLSKVNIPSAFQALTTVQMLAPVAKYATGSATSALKLSGALGQNMIPLFAGLTGNGSLQTSQLALHDFPAMNKLVDVTKLQFLNNPTLAPIKTAFRIDSGRLAVQPFDVKVGGATMRVAGSNGLDQSMQYTLDLRVPRSLLGSGANQALANLVSQAGKAGVDLQAAPEIPLAIQIGGTVTNPKVTANVQNLASSVTKGAEQAATQAATQKASAAATKLVQDAEANAAKIRQDAQALADKVKQEGNRQADSVVAKAGSNPLVQVAAKAAADKLRKEANDKAAKIVSEANQRADSLVAAARQQASKVSGKP
ncbi:MAG TPA: AsmA-like C-terminal region-containing protein [Gemmatimonadaceae bacterium]